MSLPIRPRRSVLYMPGSNARAIEKARTLKADAIILDLEDAVAPDAKAEARRQVAEAVRAGGFGQRELIIRINSLATPWGADDLAAAVAAGPHAILVPKIDGPADLTEIEGRMLVAKADPAIALWVMMETPRGLLRADAIAGVGGRLACLVMGTNDLVKEVHGRHTPDRAAALTGLGLSVLAARAHGLAVIDGVYNDIADIAGFSAQCAHGAAMGFDGKTLIHPSQIEAANAAFAPSAEEVAQARKILAAFALPENEAKGAIALDGRMVERLHLADAERVLALAGLG